MSAHNWWEFGKTGFKWGALGGAVIGAVMGLPAAIPTLGGSVLVGAAIGALKGGLVGGTIGGGIGVFTSDKPKGGDLVPIQTPSGRVIDVPVQDLARAQEQESSRFRDMVAQSRGGNRNLG